MSADHWHYASDIHGGAEEHHRHYDAESEMRGLREDLGRAEERIRELEEQLDRRIRDLWSRLGDMPGGI